MLRAPPPIQGITHHHAGCIAPALHGRLAECLYVALPIAVIVGYLLGSIPFAHLMARAKGIDIGSTDTRIAGTANVFRQVGRRSGAIVFMGDSGKGAAAIVFANALGIDTPWRCLRSQPPSRVTPSRCWG